MPSTWIPTAEITDQRDAAELTFNDSVIILRLTEARDDSGGIVSTYAAVGTADCRLVQRAANERLNAEQIKAIGDYILTVPHDTDIGSTDRVTVGSATYSVINVDQARTYRTALRCDVLSL